MQPTQAPTAENHIYYFFRRFDLGGGLHLTARIII